MRLLNFVVGYTHHENSRRFIVVSIVVTLRFFSAVSYSLREARLLRGKFHSHVFDWLGFFAVVAGLRNLQKSKVNIWEAVIGCFLWTSTSCHKYDPR